VASRISPTVEQYIAAMRTARSFGAHTAETTFYTPLSNLLNTVGEALKPRVVFVAHPGSRGAGLPDGGLFPVANRRQTEPLPNQRPERGAVEIKPPGESSPRSPNPSRSGAICGNTASASSPTTTSSSSSNSATALLP